MKLKAHIIMGATLVVIGCSEGGPVRTSIPSGTPDVYPLVVGNRWEYRFVYDATFRDELGDDVRPPVHREACSIRELVSTEERFGREYVVQEETVYSAEGTDTLHFWDRFRQDENGFYRLNFSAEALPDVPYSGEDPGDDMILAYPLEVGTKWFSSDSAATTTIVSFGLVETALGQSEGYELMVDRDAAGPDDYTTLWYGVCGVLRQTFHFEFDAAGPNGIVHFVGHETDTLVDVQLVGPNDCTITATSTR